MRSIGGVPLDPAEQFAGQINGHPPAVMRGTEFGLQTQIQAKSSRITAGGFFLSTLFIYSVVL